MTFDFAKKRVGWSIKRLSLNASIGVKMHATGPHISPQWIKRVQNPVQHVRSCRGRARVHRLRALPHQYSEGLVEPFLLQTKPSDLS